MEERKIPPMVNMDPSHPSAAPSITIEERTNAELEALGATKRNDAAPAIPQVQKSKNDGVPGKFTLPQFANEPIHRGEQETMVPPPTPVNPKFAENTIPAEKKEMNLEAPTSIAAPVIQEQKAPEVMGVDIAPVPNITEAVETQRKLDHPELQENPDDNLKPAKKVIVSEGHNEPLPEPPETSEMERSAETVAVEMPKPEVAATKEPLTQPEPQDAAEALEDAKKAVLAERKNVVIPNEYEDADPDASREAPHVQEVEDTTHDSITPKESDAVDSDGAPIQGDVPSDLPEEKIVTGLTDDEMRDKFIKENDEMEKNYPIATTPRKYTTAKEIHEFVDETTTHFRIIEGNPSMKPKRKIDPKAQNVTIIKNDEAHSSDFSLRFTRAQMNVLSGERKVMVVATQSGYSVMCSAMNSREIRAFGRDQRSQDDMNRTYNANMAIVSAVFAKLSDFSCGPMTFNQFIENTAYPDLQTLIFGIYQATYPIANNFNLMCTYCNRSFSVPIGNASLACVPAGEVEQQYIKDVLYGAADPRELIKKSKRYTGFEYFYENNTKCLRIRTPSILEFYKRAYQGKREDIIDEYQNDMYYAGYCRSYGIADIEEFNRSGNLTYIHSEKIEDIDRAIAEMNPYEKEAFERTILNYINKYSVSYQIPAVRCPHCKKIMLQREINMKTLFFEAKAQRGL